MELMVCDAAGKIDAQAEVKLDGVLEQLGLNFEIIKCCGCDRFCIHSNRR